MSVSVSASAANTDARRSRSKQRPEPLPRVTLKAAVTLDGRIATASGDSKWITSKAARALSHRLRAQHDAVLVGVGTVLADDPELTVRHVRLPKGRSHPLRVVLDARLRTPLASKLTRPRPDTPTLIVHGPRASKARRLALAAQGVALTEVALTKAGKLDLRAALRALYVLGIRSVLAEGGSGVHGSLLSDKLAQRVAVFVAPRILADSFALPLAAGPRKQRMQQALALTGVRYRKVGPDLLVTGVLAYPRA